MRGPFSCLDGEGFPLFRTGGSREPFRWEAPFDGSQPEGTALPPEEYRGDGAWVVSYPVSEKSMISSNDILFRQGSTQFADGHSYDMVLDLSDALDDPALAKARYATDAPESQRREDRRVVVFRMEDPPAG